MEFSKLSLLLFVIFYAFLVSSQPVHCNEKEDALFKGINDYRENRNISALKRNEKADCLADEIADDLDDLDNHPCSSAQNLSGDSFHEVPKFVNFPKLLKKCAIDVNNALDGAILPVCVPELVNDLVLSNYTNSPYTKYLNDSQYTGAGVGSEDDWMVLVLSTNKSGGSFSAATSLVSSFGVLHYLLVSFLGLFLAMSSY